MVAARRLVREQFGRGHHPAQRVLAQALTMMVWPFAVLVQFWQMRRFYGAEEMPIQRAPDAIWVALRHNILPAEYYAYKLWQPKRRMSIDNYLYSHEAARIFKVINRPFQMDPIGDKLAFYEMCKTHALPTPPVLAAFAPTRTLLDFESGQPPEFDLFVKPRVGLAGHGAERFRWREGAFEGECGGRISRKDLLEHLAVRARKENRTLLVQPNLSNHPDFRIETNGGLTTARLVTGHSSDGDVTAIFGFIYFARSGRITAQHGHAALIDITSGRLLAASGREGSGAKGVDPGYHNNFALISPNQPFRLPYWNAALQYAKIAHKACSNIVFVGWDIAFTPDGPMLLEGNANWSADEYQTITGLPLGHTRFAPVLAARLREIEA